jgi:hypothetical protein
VYGNVSALEILSVLAVVLSMVLGLALAHEMEGVLALETMYRAGISKREVSCGGKQFICYESVNNNDQT